MKKIVFTLITISTTILFFACSNPTVSTEVESSNEIKKDVEVVGICEMYFQHYLFMSNEYYQEMFDTSY